MRPISIRKTTLLHAALVAAAAYGCSASDLGPVVAEEGASAGTANAAGAEGAGATGAGTTEERLAPPDGAHDHAAAVPAGGAPVPTKGVEDPLDGLPKGAQSIAAVCARNVPNAVTRALCKTPAPTFTKLTDLQGALGLGFADKTARGDNNGDGNPGFILTGNSSSLVARFVNSINPRAVVFKKVGDDDDGTEGHLALGFTRGDHFVELAALDEKTKALTFYLVKFEQACSKTNTCTPGDLLTPKIEKDWTGWSLYQDEDLKNTVFDCRQCHQPNGPGSRPLLRFQELRDPWTHVFADNRRGGRALIADYRKAHPPTEDYGPIPGALVEKSDGRIFEMFIRRAGFGDQPNEFLPNIEGQVRGNSDGKQPEINDPPGTSRTWDRAFDVALRGEAIPVPYHDVKVTSAGLLAQATAAYKSAVAGTTPLDQMPDIRNIFLQKALEDTSIMPRAGSDATGVLRQMCQQCHNPKLDQTLSRARFDVTKLATMSKAEKQEAIARLKLPRTSAKRMPPVMFKDMTDPQIQQAIAELSK